jgi:pimeloyl-ACP methyl ester carboxylesterase
VTNQTSEFFAAYDALVARWPSGHRSKDMETRYGTTRVHVCGPPDAPPLVLFHGYGATAAVWFATAGELSLNWRVMAVDRPGEAGRSAQGGHRMRAADIMQWIDDLRAGLRLETFALCGHSYGAWLALSYALRSPSRVRALALLDPTSCFARYRTGYLLRSVPLLARPGAARAGAFLAWETAGVPVSPAWLRLAALAADVPSSGPVRVRRPSRARLRGLSVPALVILAEASKAHNIRRVAAAARASVPEVRVEVLAEASHHSIPAAQAGAVSRLLLDLLRPQVPDQ